MNWPIDDAVDILKEKLPELNVRRMFYSTLAVELTRAKTELRLTLMRELNERTGVWFVQDSRVLDGTISNEDDPKKILEKIKRAVDDGKLEGLTLQYLDERTSPEVREKALAYRRAITLRNIENRRWRRAFKNNQL